mgnify:CR=1 FL=1
MSVLSTAVVVRGDVPTVESAMAAVSVGHSSSVSVVTVIGVGGDPFSFAEVDSNRVLCLRILLLASCWSLGLLALFCAVTFFGILTGGVAECAKEKRKKGERRGRKKYYGGQYQFPRRIRAEGVRGVRSARSAMRKGRIPALEMRRLKSGLMVDDCSGM